MNLNPQTVPNCFGQWFDQQKYTNKTWKLKSISSFEFFVLHLCPSDLKTTLIFGLQFFKHNFVIRISKNCIKSSIYMRSLIFATITPWYLSINSSFCIFNLSWIFNIWYGKMDLALFTRQNLQSCSLDSCIEVSSVSLLNSCA